MPRMGKYVGDDFKLLFNGLLARRLFASPKHTWWGYRLIHKVVYNDRQAIGVSGFVLASHINVHE